MRRCVLFLVVVLPWLALATGCASYEYDIAEPNERIKHIGSKADVILHRDPLEYRLITVENRLVMRIYNPTDNPITLAGDRSSAVDPGGQSHPLLTQTMAPRSFIKLILPPPRPRVEGPGPYIGIGVGMVAGDLRRRGDRWDWYDYEPRYLTIYDVGPLYWEWNGESSVRLNFVFQRQQTDETFEQAFVIARKKM